MTSAASASSSAPAASSVRDSTSSRSIEPGELAEDPAPPAFFLGPLERPGQLAAELVHPGVQAGDDLGNPFIGRVVRAPADNEQGQEEHYKSAKAHTDPDQNGGHSFAAGRKKPADSL